MKTDISNDKKETNLNKNNLIFSKGFRMSIYDQKNAFDFVAIVKPAVTFIAALIALIALVLLFGILSELIKPQAIEASFLDNPLDMTKDNRFTKLSVTITNVTGKNAPITLVEVKPENPKNIIVSPAQTDLGLVEKGNRRITEFIVRPNPAEKVLAGTYTLNVFAVINGERFQKQMVLEIKTK